MVHPFEAVEPAVFDPTLYCMQAEAMLAPGNWVVFTNDDTNFQSAEDQDVLVGLIMRTDASKIEALEVNVFLICTKALSKQLRLPINQRPFLKWIPHILRTTRSKWITTKSVSSIAWVFSPEHLENRPNEGHQGMSNLFLCAFDDAGDRIVRGCHPFCSYYGLYSGHQADCYQERVWNGLQTLRAEISRHLGRFSEKQGTFTRVSSNVVVGREAWRYLLMKVGKRIRLPINRLAMMTKRFLEPGMLLRSTPIVGNSQMIRFETEDELILLSTVLGELVTVEVRKRRPKYNVVDSLHVNDVMNVVAGSEEREVPFRHRTTQQGIDLIFDGTNHVRIRMRYQRYQYTTPVGDCCPSTILRRTLARKKPLEVDGCETSSDEESSDEDDSVDLMVDVGDAKVGMEFTNLGTVYRIKSIVRNERLVAATVIWPKEHLGRADQFDLAHVERWIQIKMHEELVY